MKDCNGKHRFKGGFKKGEGQTILQQCGDCDNWIVKPLHVPKRDALYQAFALKTQKGYDKMMAKFRKVRL